MRTDIMKVVIKQLPDINSIRYLPKEYFDYGRFGITNSNSFYVLSIHSSHDRNTMIGGYWALNTSNQLVLSPRNIPHDFDKFIEYIIKSKLIFKLLSKIGLGGIRGIEWKEQLIMK